MPTKKTEYIVIGDGKGIPKPSKALTIHLPPIKVKIPKEKKKEKTDG